MRSGMKTNNQIAEVRSIVKSEHNSALKKSSYSKSFGELKYNTMTRTQGNDLISEIDEGDQWAAITKF
jgi:hypothetical protein